MPLNNEQTVLSRLVKAILNAAAYNPEVQAAPACILWPDKDRQWEAAVSYTHLRAHETPEHLVCRLLLEKKNKLNNRLKCNTMIQ